MLPPQYGVPILYGARARADHAYRDWKAVVDDLWEDEYEALLVEQAARARPTRKPLVPARRLLLALARRRLPAT